MMSILGSEDWFATAEPACLPIGETGRHPDPSDRGRRKMSRLVRQRANDVEQVFCVDLADIDHEEAVVVVQVTAVP